MMRSGLLRTASGRRLAVPGRSIHTQTSSPAATRDEPSAAADSTSLTNTRPRSSAATTRPREPSRFGEARNLSSLLPASSSVTRQRGTVTGGRVMTARSGGVRVTPGGTALLSLGRCRDDLQQFDLEQQRCAARNGRTPRVTVGEVRWTHQSCFAADLHLLHALGPARDHTAQRELRRLVTPIRAVELRAVDERAAVVNLHGIAGRRRWTGAGRQVSIDQPGIGPHHTWLRRRFRQIRNRCGLFARRNSCGPGSGERLDLRSPLVDLYRGLACGGVGQGALEALEIGDAEVALAQ